MDVINNLLHSSLSSKVNDYFGSEVKLNCLPKSSEPTLRGTADSVIGVYTLVCTLNSPDGKSEPLYQMEMDLEFTIHPETDSDGKSLKSTCL